MIVFYTLDNQNNPVPCDDTAAWGEFMHSPRKIVAQEQVGDVFVSTVFLGVDHALDGGKPVLWETMIFGGPHDQFQERYLSREEALRGHAEAVALARGEEPRI